MRLSAEGTNTDTAYGKKGSFGVTLATFENFVKTCLPTKKGKDKPGAIEAARLTNEFLEKSKHVLKDASVNVRRISGGKMPGNVVLTRDGGDRLPKFPKMEDVFKIKMGCFV